MKITFLFLIGILAGTQAMALGTTTATASDHSTELMSFAQNMIFFQPDGATSGPNGIPAHMIDKNDVHARHPEAKPQLKCYPDGSCVSVKKAP